MFNLFGHAPQAEFAAQRDRQRWADSIDGLLRNLDRPVGRLGARGLRPLYRTDVVTACAPALRQVRDVLLDPQAEVRTRDLRSLNTFICEGSVSPLLGGNADAARRGALELQSAFTTSQLLSAGDRRVAA
jgi:hypothetical protein